MNDLEYYIVDVFAEKIFTGNQLAVFRNAGSLTSDEMQSITREVNYSETTFILSDEPHIGGFDVRILLLLLRAEQRDADIDIQVGGKSIIVAHGKSV